MLRRTITLRAVVDLASTFSPLTMGRSDPTANLRPRDVWLALRTREGAATIHLTGGGDRVEAEAWGPGADSIIDRAPDLVGADDPPFSVDHPIVGPLARRHAGLRVIRTGSVVDGLIRAVLGQKVTGREAKRSFARLTRATSEPAPGPQPGLMLPPDPEAIAAMGYHRLHPMGVERRRSETLIRVARHAKRLDEAAAMSIQDAYRRVQAVHGIGPWSAAVALGPALGDADAVPVGDFHIPNTVSWALAGEPRGTDDRMLELLEPFAGNRGRVIRLLKSGGISAPKYGPRAPIRSIEAI